MRRKIFTYILILASVLSFASSCSKDDDGGSSKPLLKEMIIGEWAGTTLDAEGVHFYAAFMEDGTFELYLSTNDAPYRLYRGTYTITEKGGIICGVYDDSEPWGCDYALTFSDKSMTWYGEVDGQSVEHMFHKETIPEEVKDISPAF